MPKNTLAEMILHLALMSIVMAIMIRHKNIRLGNRSAK